jgi:hypothetical protein
MEQYIIFNIQQEAIDLINQINTCMGWPNSQTETWMIQPDVICSFDFQTGDKVQIGYGIIINDTIYNCLTEIQKTEVFVLPSNYNVCSWDYSGTTISQ